MRVFEVASGVLFEVASDTKEGLRKSIDFQTNRLTTQKKKLNGMKRSSSDWSRQKERIKETQLRIDGYKKRLKAIDKPSSSKPTNTPDTTRKLHNVITDKFGGKAESITKGLTKGTISKSNAAKLHKHLTSTGWKHQVKKYSNSDGDADTRDSYIHPNGSRISIGDWAGRGKQYMATGPKGN